mmetsp:Transcript_14689/g.43717  ORF Transcript_14689/g.43717 Transcript_14689/m.43717 type:complete len:301 (-) Transcript_14689:1113-2015(-)
MRRPRDRLGGGSTRREGGGEGPLCGLLGILDRGARLLRRPPRRRRLLHRLPLQELLRLCERPGARARLPLLGGLAHALLRGFERLLRLLLGGRRRVELLLGGLGWGGESRLLAGVQPALHVRRADLHEGRVRLLVLALLRRERLLELLEDCRPVGRRRLGLRLQRLQLLRLKLGRPHVLDHLLHPAEQRPSRVVDVRSRALEQLRGLAEAALLEQVEVLPAEQLQLVAERLPRLLLVRLHQQPLHVAEAGQPAALLQLRLKLGERLLDQLKRRWSLEGRCSQLEVVERVGDAAVVEVGSL